MRRKIVVRREVVREVYLHNILEDLLFEVDGRFDRLTKSGPELGWKQEAIAGIIFNAMLNEGWINAIGEKAVPDWKEMLPAEKKLQKIVSSLMSDLDLAARPLSSVNHVRKIRNEFAHAKPIVEVRTEPEVVIDEGDHRGLFDEMRHPIEKEVSIERYRELREDCSKFRKLMLERSGLSLWDVRTKAEESSTFLREHK